VRIGSLFAGIGGLELGLERALGASTVWQVEQDPFCRAVLEKHWPNATRYLDVRTVKPEDLESVDIICGGFPCQGISAANPGGGGLGDERSGLWFDMLRIIAELRPGFVVVENSPRLAGRGLDVVVGGLMRLGYSVEGSRIRASDAGAWHRRERLFLVAWATPDANREQLRVEPKRVHAAWDGWSCTTAISRDAEPLEYGPFDGWHARPALARVDNGISGRLDETREQALGNAVVPACSYIVGCRIRDHIEGVTHG